MVGLGSDYPGVSYILPEPTRRLAALVDLEPTRLPWIRCQVMFIIFRTALLYPEEVAARLEFQEAGLDGDHMPLPTGLGWGIAEVISRIITIPPTSTLVSGGERNDIRRTRSRN